MAKCVISLHKLGIVHKDCRVSNFVFLNEKDNSCKFIDLSTFLNCIEDDDFDGDWNILENLLKLLF